MGREAVCTCRWGDQKGEVKALLETSELILRGAIRRRVPFAAMQDLQVLPEGIQFFVNEEKIVLEIGLKSAEKWVKTIKNPPTLAKKLGISAATIVRVIGRSDDKALEATLSQAGAIASKAANLIVASVDTPQSLLNVLADCRRQLENGLALWLIYRKGPGHPLNENLIRELVLPTGLVDNKVAAVSTQLTAIRFVRRKR